MKIKFTKEEMVLLNAICDIKESADGTKTYSMKPMIINDNGEVQIDFVREFDFMKEGFITTDIVDRREAGSLSDIVRRLSEIK